MEFILLQLLNLILVLLLCDNFVQSASPLDSLLPAIKSFGYELTPSTNGYHLRLKTTEYVRDEEVELKNPDTPEQELSIMGTLRQKFQRGGADHELVTEYVADRNGYRAQYRLEREEISRERLAGITLKLTVAGARERKSKQKALIPYADSVFEDDYEYEDED